MNNRLPDTRNNSLIWFHGLTIVNITLFYFANYLVRDRYAELAQLLSGIIAAVAVAGETRTFFVDKKWNKLLAAIFLIINLGVVIWAFFALSLLRRLTF